MFSAPRPEQAVPREGVLSASPSVPTLAGPGERPSGGPLGLPEPGSEARPRVVCVLCPVSSAVGASQAVRLTLMREGPGHTGEVRVEKPLLDEWPFPGRQEVMSLNS